MTEDMSQIIVLILSCCFAYTKATRTISLDPERPVLNGQMNVTCGVTGGIVGDTVSFQPSSIFGDCNVDTWNGDQCVPDTSCPYKTACDVKGKQFILEVDSVPGEWHGITIYCGYIFGGDISNRVEVFVQVPVTSVAIIPSSTVTVTENENVNVTCETTACRPAANISWYKDNILLNNNIVQTIKGNITMSTLVLTGDRLDRGKKVHCEATNIQGFSPVKSAESSINVLYAPTGSPSISPSGHQTYNETNTVALTCTLTKDGNPAAVWSWICNNQPMSQGQITTVDKGSRLTFTATKDRNGHQCYCRVTSPIASFNQRTNNVTVNIQYSPSGVINIYPTGMVTYNETNTVALTCTLSEDGNPAAVWSWICNNQPMSQGQITTIQNGSKLIFSATKDRNGHQCYCRATSPIGRFDQASTAVTLNIQYKPTGIPSISPTGTVTYNETNTVTLTCILTEDGNPAASWSWICYNQPMSQSRITTVDNGSRLTFTATKDRNGHQCYCRAMSPIASYNQASTAISLNIQYAARVQNIKLNGGSGDRVKENMALSVNCKVDSNPPAITQIINMDNGTIFQTQNGMWNISDTDCFDTATYKCEASNGHGIPGIKSFDIHILCSPRQDSSVYIKTNYGVPQGGIFTLSARFIAYPLPLESDVKWIFRFNKTDANSTIVNDGTYINVTRTNLGKNVCNINLTKLFQYSNKDYGEYVAEVKNELGKGEIVYTVFPARPPNPPKNVSLNCETPVKVIVSWISSFNGGEDQHFYVKYNIYNSTNIQEYPVEKNVQEEDRPNSQEIKDLKENTHYSFAVFANNSYGSSAPTATVWCKVLGSKANVSSSTAELAGAIGGTVTTILVVSIATVLGIILIRRYRDTNKVIKEQQQRSEHDKHEEIQQSTVSVSQSASSNYEQLQGAREQHTYDILDKSTVSISQSESPNYEQLQGAREQHTYDIIDKNSDYINLQLR